MTLTPTLTPTLIGSLPCKVCNGGGGDLKIASICSGVSTLCIASLTLAGIRVFLMPRQVAPLDMDFHVDHHLEAITEIETPPGTPPNDICSRNSGVVLAQLSEDLSLEDFEATSVSNPLAGAQVPMYVVQGRLVGESPPLHPNGGKPEPG